MSPMDAAAADSLSMAVGSCQKLGMKAVVHAPDKISKPRPSQRLAWKPSAGPGAIFMPEPMRQVDDDAGEKTCFREAQKKTGDIKLHRRMNHGDQYGDESPGNQDARNPFPSAPALHNERSRNLKQEVTGKKNACAQTKYAIRETQVVGHLKAGKTHVDPIQICDEVKDEEEGQEPPGDAAPGSFS